MSEASSCSPTSVCFPRGRRSRSRPMAPPGKRMDEGALTQALHVIAANSDIGACRSCLGRGRASAAEAPGDGMLPVGRAVEDSAGNSRVDVELDYELRGGFVGTLFDSADAKRRLESEMAHSLHNLKELVEGRART